MIGFTGVLAVLFIALKLLGHIDWAWGWVLAPVWGGIVIALIVTLIGALIVIKSDP